MPSTPDGQAEPITAPIQAEHLFVDQGGQCHRPVAQIDHVNWTRAKQVILFKLVA